MQTFMANGRVASIAEDALGHTNKGTTTFKFNFVCDSSQMGEDNRPIPTFFPVQLYGTQAEVMARSLSKGSPILVKGEIVQRPYVKDGKRRTYTYIAPSPYDGITFLENKEASERRRQSQTINRQDAVEETNQAAPFSAGEYAPVDPGNPFI